MKTFKKGDKVKIVNIHEDDAHHHRKDLIGEVTTLTEDTHDPDNGKGIYARCNIDGIYFNFFAVELKEVK